MIKYTFEGGVFFHVSKGRKFYNYNEKQNLKDAILKEYKIKRNIKELSKNIIFLLYLQKILLPRKHDFHIYILNLHVFQISLNYFISY